jgi:predicted transcriptional regulator
VRIQALTQIAISDEVASSLASAAASRGCSQEELASMLIEQGLRWDEEIDLTSEQEARLLHSFAQAERGELIDGDVVMSRIEQALQKIESR